MAIRHPKKKRNVLGSIWLGPFAIVVLVMLYGVVRYPYAPIRYRDGAYFDKVGHEFTATQFRSFKIWERCLVGAFVLAGGVSIPLAFTLRRRRKG